MADVVPLAGIGPALFPHALVWQNLGWQAVLGGRSPAQAFLLVMVGNLAALAAGTATALAGGPLAGRRDRPRRAGRGRRPRGDGHGRRPPGPRRPRPSCWW